MFAKNQIGRTDIDVTELSFGCASIGWSHQR